MNVDDIVAAKIAAARIKVQAAKQRRDDLAAARKRGLAQRHAAKLRNLSARTTDGTATETVTAAADSPSVANDTKEN